MRDYWNPNLRFSTNAANWSCADWRHGSKSTSHNSRSRHPIIVLAVSHNSQERAVTQSALISKLLFLNKIKLIINSFLKSLKKTKTFWLSKFVTFSDKYRYGIFYSCIFVFGHGRRLRLALKNLTQSEQWWMPHVGRGLFISGLSRRAVWRQDTAGLTQCRPRAYGMAYQVTKKTETSKM